jgi:hypothetical protein
MTWRGTIRFSLAAMMLAAICAAQNSQPATAQKPGSTPCPGASGSSGQSGSQPPAKPCAPPANAPKPSVADQFPFPGEAAPADNAPSSAPNAPAANAPAPNAPQPSAASEHPFPGERGHGADSGSSGNSGSSGSSSSSSDDGYDPATLPPAAHPKAPVRKVQTPDQRVDEDLRVAKFYLDADDLIGAYNRAKDAVRVEPDYAETHFMLAEVARKMKKKDEAILEYKAYLKMDPAGDRIKTVKKALADLQ